MREFFKLPTRGPAFLDLDMPLAIFVYLTVSWQNPTGCGQKSNRIDQSDANSAQKNRFSEMAEMHTSPRRPAFR